MIEIALLLIVIYMLYELRRQITPKSRTGVELVMDSSALIDGRIQDLYATGFIDRPTVIAKRVLDELQLLADGRDAHKRSRARHGLDIASKLGEHTAIIIDDSYVGKDLTTDEAVLKIAQTRHAKLCTTDYNLQKVAQAEGVSVLNVHDVARILRPIVLPGESLDVTITEKGESPQQGVGYLADGTMIVVSGASKYKGKKVRVRVERYMHTSAGKMFFGSLTKVVTTK